MQSMNFANANSDLYRRKFQAILATSPYFGKFSLYNLLRHKKNQERISRSRGRVLTSTYLSGVARCNLCDYNTGRISNLRRHILTMHRSHGNMTLTCCNETFPDKGAYRLHGRTVHKDGHECQTCHRIFTRRALLRRHQSVHTGIKEFECHLCSYATSHKSNLERHFKIHVTGGRPKSHNPRSKTDVEVFAVHRNLGSNWLKKRRTANGGLHPGVSTSTALLKTRLDRQNKVTMLSSSQSKKATTSLDELRPDKLKLSHSIDSILNRPSKSDTQYLVSKDPLQIKSDEVPVCRAWLQDVTQSEPEEVEAETIKKEIPAIQEQEPQVTYFMASDRNHPYFSRSYVGLMPALLAAFPHFQQNNSPALFPNQNQDLRLHFNSYNSLSSFLAAAPNASASSASPQQTCAITSSSSYLNYSLLAPNNPLPSPLDFNFYQHLLYLLGLDFLAQQSRPELIFKKEQTEKASSLMFTAEGEEPSLTCRVSTSAPINTSLTAFTGGDSPQPLITATHKNVAGVSGSSNGTSVTVRNLNQQSPSPRKLIKRRNAEIQELCNNNTEEEAAIVTGITGIENHIPLKKRRADANSR